MRGAWVLALAVLLTPALGGCLSFLDDKEPRRKDTDPADVGYDPATIRVTGVRRTALMVPSFDGVELSTVIYEPVSSDVLEGNVTPAWGTVVFLHGWGGLKEEFEGVAGAAAGQGAPVPDQAAGATAGAPYGINRLQAFAEAGLIAIAYDARGFGQSGGSASVAGPAESADLDAILDHATANLPVNGRFGIVGLSYGGGQAYNALAGNPRITTVVPMYGWVDLYHGLAPGNVPKLEWAAVLGGGGAAGSAGNLDPMIATWYQAALTRNGLDTVKAQMTLRSSLDRLPTTDKPLFICQGLQETLFPQADIAWSNAGGFTRALVFTGGHGDDDPLCWERALTWFRHFLGGFDGGVESWPALSTVGAEAGRSIDYATFPETVAVTYYPFEETLQMAPSSRAANTTYTVEQRLLANPFNEPSAVWDQLGLPTNGIPEQMRQDPTALFFSTTLGEARVLMGSARVEFVPAADATAPLQVTGILFKVDGNGRSQILSRGAVAVSEDADLADGLALRFDWTKADFAAGDKIVLRLGANDPSMFMQYPANYAFDFTGMTRVEIPFYEG